ncbi:TonB-dependent receptor plug domain-containing protein [Glaciecola petra]|uniref:TonB-dependent receptor n=1 Tax=Glaciecola petra TaxID=3075602 RepID=A0ABU2ZL82_9ALTE|nr:TonB-dependent receptor [Aestuariibacter sp. P117]MDT0593385.1 TonB-dependent receptor [Aestuariibacter sp. P117]
MFLYKAVPACVIFTTTLAYTCAHAHVQEPTLLEENANDIEKISIVGFRDKLPTPLIAGSVNVIDETQILAAGAISIVDLLRTLPSVNISQSGPIGSLSEIRLRGSESNHVMVLVDGVEINDTGQGGLVDLSHILLTNIERIEVLRGPQSALWGSSAIAGVISITSKQASSEENKGQVKLGWGNRNTSQISAHASQIIDKLSIAMNLNMLNTNGENISREGSEKDGYSNTSLYSKLAYRFDNYNQLRGTIRYLDYENDFDATDFSTGLLADANNKTQGEQISLGLDWEFAPSTEDAGQPFYSQLLTAQYSKQSNDNFSEGIFNGSTKGEKLRILWNNRFQFSGDNSLNLGLESVEENFEQVGIISFGDPNQTQDNFSYSFVSNGQYALSDAMNVSLSYRYDNNDEFDNASSYRIGATYQINNHWRAFISNGTAVNNPTFTERFGFFPQTFLGNPDLEPEQQESVELGLTWSGAFFGGYLGGWLGKNNELQLAWFKATLQNEILGFVFDANSGQFTAQNADINSTREGFEVSLNGEIDTFKNGASVNWKAHYSYLDASENSQAELRRSPHSGSVNISYINNTHQFYLQADYTGSRLDRFFPPFPEPSVVIGLQSYWLLSANYIFTYNRYVNFNVRLSNILNEKYEDVIGFSGESSRVMLSASYRW